MPTRRQTLQHSAAVAALLAASGLLPQDAQAAFNSAAFSALTVADALRALGASAPQASPDVGLVGPDVADNGAAVSISLSTTLPNAQQLLILVDKNVSPLAARFHLTDSVEPNFALRIKMSESADVYAVAITTDGRAWFAKRHIKVILGACNG